MNRSRSFTTCRRFNVTAMKCAPPFFANIIVIILLLAVIGAARTQDLLGRQSLSVFCDTASKLSLVLSHDDDADFIVLRTPRSYDEPVDLLVAANRVDDFMDELRANGIEFKVHRARNERTRGKRYARYYNNNYTTTIDFNSYPRYQEITTYLQTIAKKYPWVRYKIMGYSAENREIICIKFSSDSSSSSSRKPAIFIDAGIHAREWIAPTTALYAIKQLAENASLHYLFRDVDIYIVPLVNPDGYEYSHYNETTKYWRKSRTVYNFTECRGADINRNFDLEWMTYGASDLPCTYTYAGSRPFSESEARALRDFMLARRDRIVVYLTLHSFGQYFLHPWGFTSVLPPNEPTLRCTATAALNELTKVRGTVYKLGSSTNVLYKASGGSDDWAMGIAGIPIVFTIELPPLPGATDNFFPPVSEIEPVGRETFEAIKVFIRYANGELCTSEIPAMLPSSPSRGGMNSSNDMISFTF